MSAMSGQEPLSEPDGQRLTELVTRMVEVKERRDALDAEYAQLRDDLITLTGTGRRVLPNGFPVVVSARRSFDANLAAQVLNPNLLAQVLAPPKADSRLARAKLSQEDYERCLSGAIAYNVRLG